MKKFNNKGFSMVEAIIMIAVLTTVMVMAFPNFIEFFKLQEEVSEERTMNEIREALKLYADAKKSLPETATWSTDLAPFTSLTENAIANDVWGMPRYYERIEDTLTYRSSNDVAVHYAVVYGYGPDRLSANAVDGADGAMNWAGFFDSVNTPGNDEDYSNLEVADDDFMIKTTNYAEQVRNYEETEKRLQAISDALANYAIAQFNAAQLAGVANSERLNYYPPSDWAWAADSDDSDYYDDVEDAYRDAHPTNEPRVRNNDGSEDEKNDRARDMKALMRLLGLPLSYCCSALEIDPDTEEEPAFFYYSNPAPLNGGGGCNPRPAPGETRLPPRLSVTPDNCG